MRDRDLPNIYKEQIQVHQSQAGFEYNPWVRALGECARTRTLHYQRSSASLKLDDGRNVGALSLHVVEQWMLIRLHAYFKEMWPGDQSEWKNHLKLSDERLVTGLNAYAAELAEGVITPLLAVLRQPAIVRGVLDGLAQGTGRRHAGDWSDALRKIVHADGFGINEVREHAELFCADLKDLLVSVDLGAMPTDDFRQQLDALAPKGISDLKIDVITYLYFLVLQFLGFRQTVNSEVEQAQQNFRELAKRDFNDLMNASPVRSRFNTLKPEDCFSKRRVNDYHALHQQVESSQKDREAATQRSAHGETQRASAIGFFAAPVFGLQSDQEMYASARVACGMFAPQQQSCAQEVASAAGTSSAMLSGPTGLVSS